MQILTHIAAILIRVSNNFAVRWYRSVAALFSFAMEKLHEKIQELEEKLRKVEEDKGKAEKRCKASRDTQEETVTDSARE